MVEPGTYPDPDEPQALTPDAVYVPEADMDVPTPAAEEATVAVDSVEVQEAGEAEEDAGASPGAAARAIGLARAGASILGTGAMQGTTLVRAYPRAAVATGLSVLVLCGVLSMKGRPAPLNKIAPPAETPISQAKGGDAARPTEGLEEGHAAAPEPTPSAPEPEEKVAAPAPAIEEPAIPEPAQSSAEGVKQAVADVVVPDLPPEMDLAAEAAPEPASLAEPLAPDPSPLGSLLVFNDDKPGGDAPAPAPAPVPHEPAAAKEPKADAPPPAPATAASPEPTPTAGLPPEVAPSPSEADLPPPLPAAAPATVPPAIPPPVATPASEPPPTVAGLPPAAATPLPTGPATPAASAAGLAPAGADAAFDLGHPAEPTAPSKPASDPSPAEPLTAEAVAPLGQAAAAIGAALPSAVAPVAAPAPAAAPPTTMPAEMPTLESTPGPAATPHAADSKTDGDWIPIKHNPGPPRLDPLDMDLTDEEFDGRPRRGEEFLADMATPTTTAPIRAAGAATAAVAAGGAAAAAASTLASDADSARRDEGKMDTILHKVQPGENFWTISRTHYASGRYYKALGKANSDQFQRLQDLYVGAVVRIPPPEDLDPALIDPPGGKSARNRDPDAAEEQPAQVAASDSPRLRRSRRLDGGELNLPVTDPEAEQASDRDDRRRSPREDSYATAPRRAAPVHKVRARETLRSIARERLGDSRRAREILDLNRDAIPDPAHLTPGQVLDLPDDAE